MLVRTQTTSQIKAIEIALQRKFYDTKGSTGPFSAIAIFMALNYSDMIQSNMDPAKVLANTQGPGPMEMLRASEGVPDRARKERQQATLHEIIQKFENSGLPAFTSSS